MRINQLLLLISGSVILTTSCKREGCTDSTASNYDGSAKKDDGSCLYEEILPAYTIPSNYEFTDGNNNSTVNFNGQAQRLEMLSEMITYTKTANTSGTSLNATQLKNMFANNGFTWVDADNLGMTGSSKQLKNKAANGDVIITDLFETYLDSIETVSMSTVAGSDGVAGVVTSNSGAKQYLQSATGIEYTQLIEKGLMSAVFYYQISQVYLGSGKLDVDNTVAVDPSAGEYYTTMEHHWDEAYGYFTTATDYPTNGTDRFLGKYANSREALMGSATKIDQAFRTGRAAISNNDIDERDVQIEILRKEIELVLAGTAIHYLNAAISNITDDALRNHELSEAIAFIDGLKYGNAPIASNTQITAILALIGLDFYAVSAANLTSARDQISMIYDLDAIKAQL